MLVGLITTIIIAGAGYAWYVNLTERNAKMMEERVKLLNRQGIPLETA